MRVEFGAQSSAAHLFARTAAPIAAFVVLYILSAAAFAQSCAPPEPRSDSGEGFTPFGANEQALGRGGNKGRAWEWALGTDTRAGQKVQASLDWVSGRVYSWKLVNSGAGSEVLEVRDAERVRLRLAYPSGMDAGNALELRVGTRPGVGAKTSIEASLTSLNGYSVSGSLSQPGTRARSEQALYYYFPPMAQGFTAEGTLSLTYPKKLPSGSLVQFTVRAGTIPCSSTGNPPTVSISAPAANSAFSAPATIAVIADAQDSGTVAQVVFYANGNPIGTATSSPFTIQWTNVQAGSYSLTAVAIDNDGLQTTSAQVPVTVSARQALYFIHVDHLNTPRLIADSTQKTVWKWDQQEPFGTNPANDDPDGNTIAFSFPQRFPGQYYDAETLLHYNYFRDYDPGSGRFVQSDPVGLPAGLNTFTYAYGAPPRHSDPTGLDVIVTYYPGGPGHIGIGVNSSATVGLYPQRLNLALALCRDVPGIALSDQTRQSLDDVRRSKSITIATTFLQDEFMQQYLDAARGSPNLNYNLCSQQCTRFVIDALAAGGVGLPRFDSVQPQDLFDLLQRTFTGP